MRSEADPHDIALVLAAHGERQAGARNENVRRIERALAQRHLVAEVVTGFISGSPTVRDALNSVAAWRTLVYPLFAANGYFTRDRLVRLVDEADHHQQAPEILTPLGLDPGLPDLLVECGAEVACAHGFGRSAALVLLGHGSRRYPQSAQAAGQLAGAVRRRGWFSAVECALLEQHPFLGETVARLAQPLIVIGLFSGEGVHGAIDAPRLVAGLGRVDVIYAGSMGALPGVERLIEAAVGRAIRSRSLRARGGT